MKTIKRNILLFQIGLFISGATAFFIPEGIPIVVKVLSNWIPTLLPWITHVENGLHQIHHSYSFFLYGTDWLAFAHILFAILFIGAYRNPLKNKWLFEFGMIACVLILPTAFIAGYARGIPPLWSFFDSLFGIIGFVILYQAYKKVQNLLSEHTHSNYSFI